MMDHVQQLKPLVVNHRVIVYSPSSNLRYAIMVHLAVHDAVIPASCGPGLTFGLDNCNRGQRAGWKKRLSRLDVCVILARVGGVVLQPLHERVHAKREDRAHARAQPVDPVIPNEPGDDSGTEGSGRVDGGAGEVCASNVCNEDGDSNADGGKEGGSMLLHREEVDGEDELRCEEHLEEETLDDAGAVAQRVGDTQRAGQEAICHGSCCDTGDELGRDDA